MAKAVKVAAAIGRRIVPEYLDLADWAEAYGGQNDFDQAALVEAIKSGRVKAVTGEAL